MITRTALEPRFRTFPKRNASSIHQLIKMLQLHIDFISWYCMQYYIYLKEIF